MITAENTWKELKDSGVDTAIVSFGAIEQHGLHLPLATDFILAQERALELGRRLNAYVLPTMPFGCSREHMSFPGTITLRPATLAAVLEDIVESLYHHGFRKIVLFSAHGGNWILKPVMRELNFKYKDLRIVWAGGPIPDRGDSVPEDIHAGRSETARMLHVRPDLVREEFKNIDSPGRVGQEFNDYIGFEKTTKTGAWGKPSEATAELGAAMSAESVERQVEYIRWAFAELERLAQAPDILNSGGAQDSNRGR